MINISKIKMRPLDNFTLVHSVHGHFIANSVEMKQKYFAMLRYEIRRIIFTLVNYS